jgi:hypothetical protein
MYHLCIYTCIFSDGLGNYVDCDINSTFKKLIIRVSESISFSRGIKRA